MAHAVVRTDNLYGTDVRAALVSIKYMGVDGTTPTELDNGNVLKIGQLMEGEREIYVGGAVAATDELKDIAFVVSPEVMYDERLRNLDDYYNVAGKACRGYILHYGDIFSVTKDALTGASAPAVGNIVELAAGTKMKVVESLTSGSTQVGQIIAIDIVGRYTYYVIRVGANVTVVEDDET